MSCPLLYTLYENKCLFPCNKGYVEYPDDPTYCVSTYPCPVGTTKGSDIKLCVKNNLGVPNPTTGCPLNQMEWIHNQCMINCYAPLLEDVTDCHQILIQRLELEPDCNSAFYTWQNSKCVRNESFYFLLFFLIGIGIFLYIYMQNDLKQE